MMGYTTRFMGQLAPIAPFTVEQVRELNSIAGEDIREHPEWKTPTGSYFSYIDLQVTKNLDGIEWSGAEKSYDMCEQVNLLIALMRRKWPEFGLCGALAAQGEEFEDAWTLQMVDGVATKVPRERPGEPVECPECGTKFRFSTKATD